jgi:hypothetical protein
MMLTIFLILTCAISLTLHMPMDVIIHNQHSGIELTSPVCSCDGRIYDEHSVERMGDGTMMKVGFRFDLLDKLPGGILMYEVQRKGNTGSNHQASTDTTSIEAVEDTPKRMRFLVTWEIDSSWKFNVRTMLVEHSSELILNEAKLAQLLYDKIYDIPSKYYSRTWSIFDNTVLQTTYETLYEKGRELKINISEGVEYKDTMNPIWIDSERQVSFSTVI